MTRRRTEHQFILNARNNTRPAVKQASDGFRGLNDDLKDIGSELGKLKTPILALTAAVTGSLTALTISSMKNADALGKYSDRLGIASEKLAGLRFAAEQTAGITGGQLDTALQRMTRRVAEASQGLGSAQGALAELNLDARELNSLAPDQQFNRIADAMQGVENRSDQVRLAFKLFDSEGVGLVNTLDAGSEGLREFQIEADSLGIALSRVDIAKIEQANDAINKVKQQAIGLGNSIAVAVAPALTALANGWISARNEAGDFADVATNGMEFVVKAVGFVSDSVRGLQVVWLLLRQGVAEVIEVMIGGITQVAQAAQSTFNAIARIVPKLEEATFGDRALEVYQSFAATNDEFLAELNELANREMPSNTIARFYAEAKADAEALAIETAAARANMSRLTDFDPELEEQNTAKAIEELQKRLATVTDFLLSEEDRIRESYRRRQQILRESREADQITDARYRELTAQLEARRDNELAQREQQRLERARANLETITALFLTEEQRIQQTYEKRLEVITEALEAGVLAKEEFDQLEIELEQYKQDQLTEIARQGEAQRRELLRQRLNDSLNLTNSLGDLAIQQRDFRYQQELEALRNTEGLSEEEVKARERAARRTFENNKRFQYGMVGINTAAAVMNELATNPDPWSKWLTVGAIVGTGLKSGLAIRNTGFGGASSIGDVSPPSAATQNPSQFGQREQQNVQQNVTFNITGSASTGEIVDALKDFYDRDGVLFDMNTAQGQIVNG